MAQKDVNLVIKAKNDATRAIDSVASALNALAGVQDKVSASAGKTDGTLSQFGTTVAQLSQTLKSQTAQSASQVAAAYDKISAEADKATEAFRRQQTALDSSKDNYAALKAQVMSAEQAIVSARLAMAKGGDSGQAARLQAAQQAYKDLNREASRVQSTFAAQEDELTRSAARLKQIESAALAAQAAMRDLSRTQVAPSVAQPSAQRSVSSGPAGQAAAAYRGQVAAVDATRQAYAEARAEAARLGAQMAATQTPTLGLETAFTQAKLAAAQAREEYQKQSTQLATLKGATQGSFAAFSQAATAMEAEAKAARAAAAANTALSNALPPINPRLQQVAGGLNQVGGAATKAGNALQQVNGKTKGPFLGLKPYELQNLSYQINDLFTQIGSGTPVTQAFAQQGGQIFQLFQAQLVPALARIGPVLAAWSVPIAAAIAGLVSIGAALKNIADRAASVKEFGAALAASADGASYSATKMAEAAHDIDVYGGSLEDARAAIKTFNAAGIDQSQFVRFGKTAQDLADVTGKTLPEAAKTLADAFSGGWKQIDELDRATNFLTAAEYEHIKSLFESGEAAKGRSEAFAIFERNQDAAAKKTRGPWSEAVRNLTTAWDGFLDSIANSKPITATIAVLSKLINLVKQATDLLPGNESLGELLAKRARVQAQVTELQGSFFGNIQTSPFGNSSPAQRAAQQLADLDAQIAKKRQEEAAKLNAIRLEGSEQEKKSDARALDDAQKKLDAAKKLTDEARIKAAADAAALTAGDNGASDAAIAAARVTAAAAERLKIEKENSKETAQQLKDATDLDKIRGKALVDTAQQYVGRSENNAADSNVLQNLFKQAGQNVDPKMTAWCAAFVNAVLATNGLPGTGSLKARSFLNYGQETSSPQQGDIVVLKRGGNADQGHVGFFQGFDANGGVKVLGGNQGNKVGTDTFNPADVLSFRRAPSPADVYKEAVKDAEALQKKQEALNASVDEFVRKGEADNAIAAARLAKDEKMVRELTIQKEIADKIAAAKKDGLTLTEGQLMGLYQTTAATYDLANAERLKAQQQTEIEKPVNDLLERRKLLQEQITFAQQQGNVGAADALKGQLQGVNSELQLAIDRAIAMWRALGGPEADNAILKLQGAKAEVQAVGNKAVITGAQANEMIATGLAGAFDSFAKKVAAGENAFDAARDSFLQFASDFLRQIAQMILKQALLNMLGAGADGGGGIGGIIASAVAGIFHKGGTAGDPSAPTRSVAATVFTNAARYHNGGVAGLKPGEVPAVLQEGERIRTQEQEAALQRQLAAGQASSAPVNLKVINAIDAGDMVQQGLNTTVGEKAILNQVRNNPGAFRQALGL